MLINTVLLFLSNSLVVFIVLALLLSIKSKFYLSGFTLFSGGVIGIFLMLLLWFYIDVVSQLFDDTGLEWFYASTHVIVYILILGFINTSNKIENHPRKCKNSLYAAAILAFLIMLQGTTFLIYFLGYWSQANVVNTLFIGVVLGVGICISISILLYFFCLFLNERFYARSTELIFILFACGLFNKTSDLLLQIDFLPSSRMIFDFNFIIKEKSELGHFLKALLGYDASPTLLQIGLYFTALLTALFWCQLPRKPWRLFRFKEVIS
jgi:high-affinity iron transporter